MHVWSKKMMKDWEIVFELSPKKWMLKQWHIMCHTARIFCCVKPNMQWKNLLSSLKLVQMGTFKCSHIICPCVLAEEGKTFGDTNKWKSIKTLILKSNPASIAMCFHQINTFLVSHLDKQSARFLIAHDTRLENKEWQ